MNEPNRLLLDDLDGIDGAEFAQLLAQLLLRHLLGQVSEIDITRCTGLLHGQGDGSGNLRGLPPAHLDVIALDGKLLQDCVGMEVGGRVAIEEGDERAVLVREQAHRLDLAAADVVEDLFGGCFGGDVTQVHGPARPRQETRGHRRSGTPEGSITQPPHAVDGRLRSAHVLLVAHAIGRHHSRV